MQVDGEDSFPTAVDPSKLTGVLDLGVTSGNLTDMGPGQMAVSERYAEDENLAARQHADRFVRRRIADDVHDRRASTTVGDIVGDILIHRDDWTPHAGRTGDVVVLIDLADGVTCRRQAAVDAVAQPFRAPDVADTRRVHGLGRGRDRPDA